MAKEPSSTPDLEAALNDVFASMSFEGEGIDQALMAKVKAKMQAELSVELSQTSAPPGAAKLSKSSVAYSTAAAALPPAPPPAAGSPLLWVHFLRFDSAGPGGAKSIPALVAGYSADQTAAAFLDAFLLSQGCPPGGDARLDRGQPSGVSPATRVQPLWACMAEALAGSSGGFRNSDREPGNGEDATPKVLTTPPPANETPFLEVTVHWYPPPPAASGLRGNAAGGDATWVRVITTTRRSVFAQFQPLHTSVGDLRRVAERECGVPVEWQRLFGGSTLLDGPDAQAARDAGVVAGMNLFLTARVPGAEYGGANADLA